jgi:ribosome-associated translation inhibitor RaiA
MLLPLRITFRDLDPSAPVAEYIRKHADKLDRLFGRMTACRVVIERQTDHPQSYRVLIDVVVPGNELIVGRSAGEERDRSDVYLAIDAAFEDMERVLDEQAGKRRGEVKRHATLDERA